MRRMLICGSSPEWKGVSRLYIVQNDSSITLGVRHFFLLPGGSLRNHTQ